MAARPFGLGAHGAAGDPVPVERRGQHAVVQPRHGEPLGGQRVHGAVRHGPGTWPCVHEHVRVAEQVGAAGQPHVAFLVEPRPRVTRRVERSQGVKLLQDGRVRFRLVRPRPCDDENAQAVVRRAHVGGLHAAPDGVVPEVRQVGEHPPQRPHGRFGEPARQPRVVGDRPALRHLVDMPSAGGAEQVGGLRSVPLELQVRLGGGLGGLARLVGGFEPVDRDGRRPARAQVGRFEQVGALRPSPVVLVADGRAGQQAADVLRHDERGTQDADAFGVVEPQAGARAALQARALARGGHRLAAEAAGHNVDVAEFRPVDLGDVPQVRHIGPAVGQHGGRAGVYIGERDDPRAAQRPLHGQVEAAVPAEQRHEGGAIVCCVCFHTGPYASRRARSLERLRRTGRSAPRPPTPWPPR